ncbi:type II secretion system F family protein [Paenibacillus daejeonensis]|uniref:type II secretion system F family protein n=1 Tax=Paenibacillus daejeonensis TaxID=135193 RepID=UPI000381DABA|nr:type II secretion system F family protein [Paenibacillus daejeonensis]
MTLWLGLAAGVLFLLLLVMLQRLMLVMAEQEQRADRLVYRQRARWSVRLMELLTANRRLTGHLSDALEAMRWPLQAGSFLLLCCMLALAGIAAGGLFFQSAKGVLLTGVLAGALPYLCLRMLLTHRQLKTRMDFLPAVELFYQCYLITGGRQVKVALQRTVEERRMMGGMQQVFEQLQRNLSIRGDDEASLRIFAGALGHVWGDYFVQILRVALAEGHPVADNLKELITDMRKARRANQQERNKLLEIRIANFSPVVFLALFVGINFRYNPESAYYYYVLDPRGRDLLLNAAVLIFVSFVMGLWLSRKKM